MEHRRFLNHNRKAATATDPLAGLLADIQSQTVKLHGALESVTVPAPVIDIQTQLAALNGAASDFSGAIGAIANDINDPSNIFLSDLQQASDRLSAASALIATASSAIAADVTALQTPAAQQPASGATSQPAQPAPPDHKPHPHPGPRYNITWPSFHGTDAFIGTSPSGMVNVYLDASLGAEAQKNAADLLADADRVVAINNAIFGKTQTTQVNVILFALGDYTDGSGGADHMGCDWRTGSDIEVCVAYGGSTRCSGLFMAELCECAMNNQLCGLSTGEALSRWCAAVASSNALSDFATAPTWQQDGSVDFVDTVDPTDQNPDSIGCGMAFISYLLHRGATLPQIAQAMVKLGDVGTLATLYQAIGMGAANLAWPTFSAAVSAVGTITTDDPFAQVAMAMKEHDHV